MDVEAFVEAWHDRVFSSFVYLEINRQFGRVITKWARLHFGPETIPHAGTVDMLINHAVALISLVNKSNF